MIKDFRLGWPPAMATIDAPSEARKEQRTPARPRLTFLEEAERRVTDFYETSHLAAPKTPTKPAPNDVETNLTAGLHKNPRWLSDIHGLQRGVWYVTYLSAHTKTPSCDPKKAVQIRCLRADGTWSRRLPVYRNVRDDGETPITALARATHIREGSTLWFSRPATEAEIQGL